jgi:beta-lactam-binding protein with PASTA domain
VKEQDMHVAAPSAGAVMTPMYPPGTVVGQNPLAGSRVDGTMAIELTVAK